MDLALLIRRAGAGDQRSITQLVRRHQNMVFGYAVSLLGNHELAREVTQDAFLAAITGLGRLDAPVAFPGWIRTIARRKCLRARRRQGQDGLNLETVASLPAPGARQDEEAERRDLAAQVRAAIAALPTSQRSVVHLFYIEDYTQREIGAFLGVPVSVVNNRLHAARSRLKATLWTLVEEVVGRSALGAEFAKRIGTVVRVLGPVADVEFRSEPLPEVLESLAAADSPRARRAVVICGARPGERVVRCLATSARRPLRKGMRIVPTKRSQRRVLGKKDLREAVKALGSPSPPAWLPLLETGIKVIDLLCPLRQGARIGIAGDPRAGKLVLVEELVRRVARASGGAALFGFVHPQEADFAREVARRNQWDAATPPPAQSFYLLSGDAAVRGRWEHGTLDALLYVDSAIARRGLYPAIAPLRSWSALLAPETVGEAHAALAEEIRGMLGHVWGGAASPGAAAREAGPSPLWQRAEKLALFMSQPFYVAESFTGVPGSWVPREHALEACRRIIEGLEDAIPIEAFRFVGTLDEARAREPARE